MQWHLQQKSPHYSGTAPDSFYTLQAQYALPLPFQQITIKGRWLEQIGFYANRPVIVKIEDDQLIIKLVYQF
ncbi:SymE family type I addiction module toxin [Photorhabdus tasmaniensis]|uniref:SymE family type I addiction module toxin n=1 Tax=Photorhabdus TaxID=29487 RepID=UPI001414E8EE